MISKFGTFHISFAGYSSSLWPFLPSLSPSRALPKRNLGYEIASLRFVFLFWQALYLISALQFYAVLEE